MNRIKLVIETSAQQKVPALIAFLRLFLLLLDDVDLFADNRLNVFHRLTEPRAVSRQGTHPWSAENPLDGRGSRW